MKPGRGLNEVYNSPKNAQIERKGEGCKRRLKSAAGGGAELTCGTDDVGR